MDLKETDIQANFDKELRKNEITQRVSQEIVGSTPLKTKLENILKILKDSYGLQHSMLLFPDKEQKELTVFASLGFNQSGVGAKTPFGQGIVGMVAKKKKKIRMAGITKYRQYAHTSANKKGIIKDGVPLPGLPDLDSQLAIPLIANEELIAVLSIESEEHNFFTKEDENFLQSISQQIALSIQNALIIDQLEEKVARRTKEIERQNIELEKLNATKDRFFSIIGHDLKSPVSSLKVATDLIQHYSKKGEMDKLAEVGLKISTAVNNVNQLLDNLVNWAMSQRHMMKSEPKNILVKQVMKKVEDIYKESVLAKELKIDNQLTEKCAVYADLNMLMTVFRNVLSNAIKFSNKQGAITIKSSCTPSETMIIITDEGVGMAADKIEDLFSLKDKKSTLGTNREKGTGLGMVLVKDFMELNKGAVSIESKPDQGTSISLRFLANK